MQRGWSPYPRHGAPTTILIVDDSPEDRTTVRVLLSKAGQEEGLSFRFLESGKGEDGLSAYRADPPDLILLDYHLPDMDGLEFLARLKLKSGEVPLPVVLFTGRTDRVLASAALQAGAQEYLPKRFMAPEMLLRAVQSAQDRFMLHGERRRIGRELAEIAERLRLTQEAAQIGTWDWETGADVTRWSEENFILHGIIPSKEPVPFAVWQAAIHPDDRDRANAAMRGAVANGLGFELEYRVVLAHGRSRWLAGRGSLVSADADRPSRLLGISLDITARRDNADELARTNGELEQRVSDRTAALVAESSRLRRSQTLLHQAQKMEAIGQFTGVISHDFNNFLHAVVGNIDIAQQTVDEQSAAGDPLPVRTATVLRRALGNAMRAANSASQLTQRLLTFGRRQVLESTEISVNDLVSGLVDLIRQTIGTSISVKTVLADGLWGILADTGQLESALLNLIINARDAMPAGGQLMIETSNAHMDEENPLSPETLMHGPFVVLCVTDDGCGIPADVLSRIFEPFFTTKPVGRGTGLGLAMVYGFVTQSGGHVRIISEVGKGTAVKLYFPRLLRADRT